MKRLSVTVRGELFNADFTGSQNACTRWLRQLAKVQWLMAIDQGKSSIHRRRPHFIKLGLKITITPVLPESDK